MSMKHFSAGKPEKCPACGNPKVSSILYGEPDMSDPDLIADLNRGAVVLGGCLFDLTNPKWHCIQCRTEIFEQEPRTLSPVDPHCKTNLPELPQTSADKAGQSQAEKTVSPADLETFLDILAQIHAIDDIGPENLEELLDVILMEAAEEDISHPRRFFLGVPRENQPQNAWINYIKLNIPRNPESAHKWFVHFGLNNGYNIDSQMVMERFGPPSDIEIPSPPDDPDITIPADQFSYVFWKYTDEPRVLSLRIDGGKVACVSMETRGPNGVHY